MIVERRSQPDRKPKAGMPDYPEKMLLIARIPDGGSRYGRAFANFSRLARPCGPGDPGKLQATHLPIEQIAGARWS